MPAKLSTISYVHESTERLTQDFTVKELTAVSRLSDDDPTKVVYLKVKAFIPSDREIETQIEEFEVGDVIFLRGKFVACEGWYSVNATSIKVVENMDFDVMPSIGLSIMIIGITTKTVRNVNGKSLLEFYVEENLGEREPREFRVDAIHNPNLRYLSNKTNAINQSMRSTTAMLSGLISYEPPEYDQVTQEEKVPGKHIVRLEDISLISTRNTGNGGQNINVPWLQGNNNAYNRYNRTPRGASPRSPRRGRTLAQMDSTRNSLLSSALESNPVPTMNTTGSENTPTSIENIPANTTTNDQDQDQD